MYLKETNCRARLGKNLCTVFSIRFIYLFKFNVAFNSSIVSCRMTMFNES